MDAVIQTFLSELDALFSKWREREWPPKADHTTRQEVTQEID
ncbi:MAG: hypothetical protein ACE5R6_07215 [Candidatus Heimdallarchaeota archaeon]